MMLPANNLEGYAASGISNVTAFQGVDYLLAHGSGDDNVHFANSAHLLDMFTQSKVRGFRFRMFTDRLVYTALGGDRRRLIWCAVTTAYRAGGATVSCMSG